MRPVYAGIGTAALLAAGGVLPSAAALAAEPTPSADPTTTASSPAPSEKPSTPSNPPSSSPPAVSPPTVKPTPVSPSPSTPPSSSPPSVSPPPISPTPVSPPSSSPPPGSSHQPAPAPALSIKLSLSSATVAPGGTVMATMTVAAQRAVAHHAVVRLAAPGADVEVHGSLGDLGSGARSVTGLVSVDGAHGAGTVTVTATVSADHAGTQTAVRRVTVDTGGAAGSGGGAVPDAGGASFALPPIPMSAAPVPDIATPRLPLVAQAPDVAPDRAEQATTPIVMRASVSPIGLSRMSLRLAVIESAWLVGLLTTLSVLIARLRARRRPEGG